MLFNVFSDICTFSSHAGHRSRSCLCVSGAAICAGVSLSWINAAGTLTALLHITRGRGRCWGARCHPITIYTAQLWHGGVKSAAWHGGHWRLEYSIRCPEPGQ